MPINLISASCVSEGSLASGAAAFSPLIWVRHCKQTDIFATRNQSIYKIKLAKSFGISEEDSYSLKQRIFKSGRLPIYSVQHIQLSPNFFGIKVVF